MKDQADFLGQVFEGLATRGIRYCVLGGQAVNAYVDPVVSLDLDIVIATDQCKMVHDWLKKEFDVEAFPHSLNVSSPGSDLRVQIQLDPRYAEYVERATWQDVLGYQMPVAGLEDLLQGKLWAIKDAAGRPSKRQKDLADIARIIEAYPHLRSRVPEDILVRLI